ncbi:MAG TPA: sigma 54-interacting transcriptional regulator [Thermoanaerobaculia bacterium]|jgi:DNA-binding NtrC family response regulator/pSer/pThr/pTyr-binding forkhead associated (FHA) protein|nr:sigma 54-interacting transcriptional regulator [Thermoanaerobaculia bacterium]
MLRLTITAENRVRYVPLASRDSLSIGSAPDNQIVIAAPGVSRHHARIERTAKGLSIVDTSSKNGLIVGSRRVQNAVLTIGDAVRLGAASLTVEEISTSDAEMALRWAGESSTSHANVLASETESNASMDALSGPAAALRWARRVEQQTHFEIERDLVALLEDARAIVDAKSLLLLERERDDINIIAAAGSLPDERDATHLANGSAPGWQLLGRLAAHVGRTPWKREFLEFVDAKLGATLDVAITMPMREDPSTVVLPAGIIVGSSPGMRALVAELRRVAASHIDVLLLGETGTGKELMARAIHELSVHAHRPFIAVNCAAVASELLEAELFGIGRNVATGVDQRPGLFVAADGGTILLDEISEMPQILQAKLLRVLQEREVLAVGATRPRKIDVRVISSSNRDLKKAVDAGSFRSDLYFRLRAIELCVPPLRERTEDIPYLVHAFARNASAAQKKRIRGISRRALARLVAWSWPGNVRELQKIIEAAVLRCPDAGVIQHEHLGLSAEAAGQPLLSARPAREDATLEGRVESVEREAILNALRKCDGNKSRAAKLLGITRGGLYLRIKRYGIE